MLLDLLTMKDVEVLREVNTSDGMGGCTTITTLNPLQAAVIYQNSGNKSFFSDRVNLKSSHILITSPSFYSWTVGDIQIIRGSEVYNVSVSPDDVMGRGEIMVVGLDKIK